MAELREHSYGPSDEPRIAVERAADAAMRAAAVSLKAEGARLTKLFVCLVAEDVPAGELDATVAGHGYEDAAELISELVGHLSGASRAAGLQLQVHALPGVG
jgi:hypothetical protein